MPRLLPNFRDYDNPKRKAPWGWDYGHGPDRVRKTFRTKTAKAGFRKNFEARWFADRDALTTFDPAKWRRFLEIERIAGGIDELEEAARTYDGRKFESERVFSELMREKLADLERAGGVNRKRIDTYGRRFIAATGDRPLHLYSREEIQCWIDGLAVEHKSNSIRNHHKAVASIFNLAVRTGVIAQSPCQHITLPSTRGEKRTSLLSPEEINRLLQHVWSIDRGLAAVYGLLFFTGLRISMVAPNPEKRKKGEFIRRDMIDLKQRTIIVPAGIMKAQNSLVIDEDLAPPNLWAWLEHIDEAKIPEPSQTFNKRRAKLCKDVGIDWSPNAHRRCCASYMSAIHGKDLTANLLGNTGEMVAKHYQVASFRRVAKEFAGIHPLITGASCPIRK